jgi:threonine aldolase
MRVIDLRSDTVTRPTRAMREVIAHAEVGDDVYGEDPSVQRLEQSAAERFGKPAALFVPSGTMANQIAIRCHTRPGDALIAPRGAHLALYEAGGMSALSGVTPELAGRDGLLTAEDVNAHVFPDDPHYARTRLVCIENTHNRSGGRVVPLESVRSVARAARQAGLALHLDGARIFSAEVATGTPVAEWAEPFDSVSFCLSKGLGAPVGSVLVGSRDFIRQAYRARKLLGGAMRQAGVLAAAGVYALEHHVKRLSDDHERARRLAAGLRGLTGVEAVSEPETNMVLFSVANAAHFVRASRERGLRINPIGPGRLRAVTHLDVEPGDIDAALEIVREAVS